MNHEIEQSLPFGRSDDSVKETEPENMSKEDLITAYKNMSEALTLLDDSKIHEKDIKPIIKIIVYSSQLATLGKIVDEYNNVKDIEIIYKIYESIMENIKILTETNFTLYFDSSDEETFDYLIDDIGNLDYNRAGEIGSNLIKYFSDILMRNVCVYKLNV